MSPFVVPILIVFFATQNQRLIEAETLISVDWRADRTRAARLGTPSQLPRGERGGFCRPP